jgi:multidrug transporter EmrE-like cation transporter
VLTGMLRTIADEWLRQRELSRFLIKLHTMEIIHLEKIYPILNGLGFIGLLITGMSMTGLFRQRANKTDLGNG